MWNFFIIYLHELEFLPGELNLFETRMKQQEEDSPWNSLPEDIALKIASTLQVEDVCSLSSCSRFWRWLCGSDFLWESLARQRWPQLLALSGDDPPPLPCSSSSVVGLVVIEKPRLDKNTEPSDECWKVYYMKLHEEMAQRAVLVVRYIEQCSSNVSLEIRDYQKAIEDLKSTQLGFTDIQMFFFRPKVGVLMNLVGLHYCINWLDVPAEDVMEALQNHSISQRQVCVRWWKVGRWFYGFRMRDESHSRQVSLLDLTAGPDKKNEILGVLYRGAVHEVVRVQISVAAPVYSSWSHQSS